jgi:hypothetical protein
MLSDASDITIADGAHGGKGSSKTSLKLQL